MKVYLDSEYSVYFPENFNWSLVESPKTQVIAETIASAIFVDVVSRDRNLVPGLREALRVIAENSELY